MATPRQLCRLLSAHLGVDSVPYAARLVREGLLPGRGEPVVVKQLQRKGTWDDMGKLKAWLRDELLAEQNSLARDVMKDIEKFQPRSAKARK